MGLLSFLLTVSRWRFWLYLAGAYLVGFTIGAQNLSQLLTGWFWLNILFFILPANLLLYGVNDLFDCDTDAANPKKSEQEHRLEGDEKPRLVRAISVSFLLAAVTTVAQSQSVDRWMMTAFLVLAVAYSVPPFRLKARPFLDSLSNVLYAVPGFLGYQQASGRPVAWEAVAVACLWTSAMHLFSAVPDIRADRTAGLATTATLLGHRASLLLCAVLWLVFSVIVISLQAYRPYSFALLAYPVIPLWLAFRQEMETGRVYWLFPVINAAFGMGAFFGAALLR